MTIPRSRSLIVGLFLSLATTPIFPYPEALNGQEAGRIWGRVGTAGGEVYEGFIRWDRNEGSWVDVLDGSKPLDWETVREWTPDPELDLTSGDRVIEYGGYRITWDDDEANFPLNAESGIRFGHIERIQITGRQEVEIVLRSGEAVSMDENPIVMRPSPGVTVILEGGSTDLGYDLREVLVDVPGGEMVEFGWEDLEWIEFGPAPDGAQPRASRLYGTVEDHLGHRFTGPISWDNDEALASDTLDGEDEAGQAREIPFQRIATITPTRTGATVTLVTGESFELTGSDDVDDDNQGIQISDPRLGRVEVEWDELTSVRFHAPEVGEEAVASFDAFDGGHRLRGTVVTTTGDELTGWIRWDADEEYSWEFLDGNDDGATYDVELGMVASIERASDRSARVTLRDGRILELEGSNDVNEDNKGILVQTQELEASADDRGPKWIRVNWDDFEILRFHH